MRLINRKWSGGGAVERENGNGKPLLPQVWQSLDEDDTSLLSIAVMAST
jgi:hypothetical protein